MRIETGRQKQGHLPVISQYTHHNSCLIIGLSVSKEVKVTGITGFYMSLLLNKGVNIFERKGIFRGFSGMF